MLLSVVCLLAWQLVFLNEICDSSFTTSSETFPRDAVDLSVGYDNETNTILLFGGRAFPQQFITFKDHQFIDNGETYLSHNTSSYGQHYTQTNHKLWMIDEGGVYLFAVEIHAPYTVHNHSIFIPTVVGNALGCLASNQHYLFLVGGKSSGGMLNTIQIYNITDDQWLQSTPTLNQARRSASCLVVGSSLYAIGGYFREDDENRYILDSIEKLDVSIMENIHTKAEVLNGTLRQPLMGTRAVSYNGDILVIGGMLDLGSTTVTDVHIIYTNTGECQLWIDVLANKIYLAASIIVHHTLFVFGGMNVWREVPQNGDYPNNYQYKMLPIATNNPTFSSTNPTRSPTTIPTAIPSEFPTNHPNQSPRRTTDAMDNRQRTSSKGELNTMHMSTESRLEDTIESADIMVMIAVVLCLLIIVTLVLRSYGCLCPRNRDKDVDVKTPMPMIESVTNVQSQELYYGNATDGEQNKRMNLTKGTGDKIDDDKSRQCVDCDLVKLGKIYEGNGCFICNDCLSLYYVDKKGGNDQFEMGYTVEGPRDNEDDVVAMTYTQEGPEHVVEPQGHDKRGDNTRNINIADDEFEVIEEDGDKEKVTLRQSLDVVIADDEFEVIEEDGDKEKVTLRQSLDVVMKDDEFEVIGDDEPTHV
eukprot:430259_1